MAIDFQNKVAIITGAGNGLGREYALALARRGAKVVVNDFGGAPDGTGGSATASGQVCDEIIKGGGAAMANNADVTKADQVEDMALAALKAWGRVDILINNAGILRDRSFAKMSLEDFAFVVNVHLMGSVNCTKSVWDTMREQKYGRILMTTSTSGLFGNFGQTNYSAAKLALVGFMNSLKLEGERANIHVNTIAPMAATRLTAGLQPEEDLPLLDPVNVVPGALFLVSDNAPNGAILVAAAGGYSHVSIVESFGACLGIDAGPEVVEARWQEISSPDRREAHQSIAQQGARFQQMIHQGAASDAVRGYPAITE